MDFANIQTDPATYDTWRTVEAPLTDSRIMDMAEGRPVHLILWPGSRRGTRYVLDRQGKMYLTVTQIVPTEDGRRHWHFNDQDGSSWEALTVDNGQAMATVLTRKALI